MKKNPKTGSDTAQLQRAPSQQHPDKLSAPHLHALLQRPRLFAVLDTLRATGQATWIFAPPGAGKTSLVTSYLEQRATPAIWYHVDATDRDPASLFHHLRHAWDTRTGKDSSGILPRPDPQTVHDPIELIRFARLFFRAFYDGLPEETVLVLENIHEFDWRDAGHLMTIAFSEVPRGIHVIAVSREAPPARLARLRLTREMGSLDWPTLRFDEAEARALGELDGHPIPPPLAEWFTASEGWVTGLVLMNGPGKDGNNPPPDALPSERVFTYFNDTVFARLPVTERHHLLCMSHLSGLSASDAIALTGDPHAGVLLERLYRNRMFVERRGLAECTYHFHTIFRDFLQHKAGRLLSPAEQREVLLRGADLMQHRGQLHEAAVLHRQASAWNALIALLLAHARSLLAAGMARTWLEWFDWLPSDAAEREPWLLYWLGLARHVSDPTASHAALIRAQEIFAQRHDARARLTVISAILDVYSYSWLNLHEVSAWTDTLVDTLRNADPATIDARTALHAQSNLAIALLVTDVASPRLHWSMTQALEYLPKVDNVATRLTAASRLLFYPEWLRPETAQGLIGELQGSLQDDSVHPTSRAYWCLATAQWYLEQSGSILAAHEQLDIGVPLVSLHRMTPLHLRMLVTRALAFMAESDFAAAEQVLVQARDVLNARHIPDSARYGAAQALLKIHKGAHDLGLQELRAAVNAIDQPGQPSAELPRFERLLACAYAATGHAEEANGWFDRSISHATGSYMEPTILERAFCRWLAQLGPEEDPTDDERHLLATLLRRHRAMHDHGLFVRFPRLAARIAELALQHGIEVPHVQAIVRRQKLQATDHVIRHWPWPISIRAFGQLSISYEGEVVNETGKAPQKPLQLLKALLIAGEGGKPAHQLGALLWPDADDAKTAVNVNLHRLRRLLGSDAAITAENGHFALNPGLIWTDVEEFSALCVRIGKLLLTRSAESLRPLSRKLLEIYAGPLLEGDEESWLLPARAHLRARFLDTVTQLGLRHEALGAMEDARNVYLQSLKTEPLSEALYCGLMRCAHALGDDAAAFSAHRQCREVLAAAGGKKPGPEIERLAAALRPPLPRQE